MLYQLSYVRAEPIKHNLAPAREALAVVDQALVVRKLEWYGPCAAKR